MLHEATTLSIPIHRKVAGDHFEFGGAEVAILAPAASYQPGAIAANDDSLVMHFAYGQTSVMLEGDAESASEARMLEGSGLGSTLLKVGHHGSSSSTSPSFLEAVSPRFAVISAGRHNAYGHPRQDTLMKLQDAHVSTYRTDTMGATTFLLNGKTVTAHPLAAQQ